ncbi:hypothetical protein C8J55DRAFT_558074 [Lentinula edodes]|uniref:Uncharacterized protein n=1 Tax=Lentinula lateritia TaxID=40482 RepID=A0A9W9DVY6_9AGAR|nr:hypothetical protein C8J55DRAFT_558074 [Lentinula edodes]
MSTATSITRMVLLSGSKMKLHLWRRAIAADSGAEHMSEAWVGWNDMYHYLIPQSTLTAPAAAGISNIQSSIEGIVPDSSLGSPESVNAAGISGGGTMSRGAAGGLKSRARVDALSWLSSVKD